MMAKIFMILFALGSFLFCSQSYALPSSPQNDLRYIRTFVYVENWKHTVLCQERTQKECRTLVSVLFEPAIARFKREFGILIRMKIGFSFSLDQSLAISSDDKDGLEELFMYHLSVNAMARNLRRQNVDVDVVVLITSDFPASASALTSTNFGTILLNINNPNFQRNVIHEFGHIFCAYDNNQASNMMNRYGTSIHDPFLQKDTERILRNKYRDFPIYIFFCK